MTESSENGHLILFLILDLCCCSVAQLCPMLCNAVDCSTPKTSLSYTIYQRLSNSCPLTQWCHQPSHPLLRPSPPAFNLSQHQALFFPSGDQSIGASTSASVLPMSIQGWFPLGWTDLISLQSKGSCSPRVLSNTTVQKHQFFGAQLSLYSNSQSIHNYWKNHSFWLNGSLSAKWWLCFLIRFLGLS